MFLTPTPPPDALDGRADVGCRWPVSFICLVMGQHDKGHLPPGASIAASEMIASQLIK